MVPSKEDTESPKEAKNHKYQIEQTARAKYQFSRSKVHKQDDHGRDKVNRLVKMLVKNRHPMPAEVKSKMNTIEEVQLSKQWCWQPAQGCQSTRMPADMASPAEANRTRGGHHANP